MRSAQAAAGRADPQRLRIGYVSSDLREHAVGFAMTDVMEQHDRKSFEIFAYYCGINRPDATQERIKKARRSLARHQRARATTQAAAKIAADGIDILVDLNGYTKDARTKVFARRPAPIIVNWFGFPGTMGTPYHHYLIADEYIIPPERRNLLLGEGGAAAVLSAERPQARRSRRSARPAPRRGCRRTPSCSARLNGMQKITRAHLSALDDDPRPRAGQRAVAARPAPPTPTSVCARSPRTAASRRSGLSSPDKMPNPDHLARYPLADLFLDSFPYGAHTTAADAMWMGVPILTLPGRSFASRVCAEPGPRRRHRRAGMRHAGGLRRARRRVRQ